MSYRSGFVAVVGRPNVGKSTLVNAIVGSKVSIVTDKAQTTRRRVRGILTTDRYQMVLADTPGFHKPRTLLGSRLNEVVEEATRDVDAVVLVVDGSSGVGRGDAFVAATRVSPLRCLKVCAVNKADLTRGGSILPQLELAAELAEFAHVFPVSALKGEGVGPMVDVLAAALPEGPPLFPPDTVTDLPMDAWMAEMVREKVLELVRDEVPHSIAAMVEDVEETEGGVMQVTCRILVERESQKGIVIGKGGATLKTIGTRARREIEAATGRRIFLDLRVKVQPRWQGDPAALARFGY